MKGERPIHSEPTSQNSRRLSKSWCQNPQAVRGHALAQEWSGRWESNPRLKLGKLGYYHYTTPAPLLDSSRLMEDQATSTDRGQIRRGDGVPGDGWPAVQSLAAGGRSRIDERAVGEHALHALVALELQDVAAEIHAWRHPRSAACCASTATPRRPCSHRGDSCARVSS